ncbi:Cell wall integrity protein [Komagataella phaffii CBS 7435]|uniref:Uncharacterized protein n=2 Tax=Komagataella phaffii TaxID=460519 RepID=C4QXM7_KOMPG|nr:uncharacterized protein PAS_chr1-4_0167 [Komagataella phaffii GS115]AOA61323.1 GQ67_02015T0 [Komagataella phaffii]CAH2446815.1 Cell wall integrity protein [Komagataella phaffii CBS 7435]AOA66119.1 GQ68_02030T0 [Komagataella phaffii GS115]CAY68000.1 Putative protein of unknown function [Komagataella phaffii GS115]CCA37075.1 Cell wall integrity protein [Komagataella phaffii CBS 7435]
MGCFRFCLVIIPALLSVVACLFAIFSCIGSTKNNEFLTSIYLLEIDASNISISALIPAAANIDISPQQLGLSDVYTLGMWGYCEGTASSDAQTDRDEILGLDNVDFTACSSPKAMYVFDPESFIQDVLNTSASLNQVNSYLDILGVDNVDISLPQDLVDYEDTIRAVSKMIFICTIIGIVLTFIQVLFSIGAFFSKGWSCATTVVSILSFVSLIIGAGGATGMYRIVQTIFNDNLGEYGVRAGLSRNFLVFYWLAVALNLIALVFWIFSICCGSTRKRSRSYTDSAEKQPMMVYQPYEQAPQHVYK